MEFIVGKQGQWVAVADERPKFDGFVWVYDEEHGVDMAYHNDYHPDSFGAKNGDYWQTAESAGDSEGLSVGYYSYVTHWMPLQVPAAPCLTTA